MNGSDWPVPLSSGDLTLRQGLESLATVSSRRAIHSRVPAGTCWNEWMPASRE
jgi:hypothetical protein